MEKRCQVLIIKQNLNDKYHVPFNTMIHIIYIVVKVEKHKHIVDGYVYWCCSLKEKFILIKTLHFYSVIFFLGICSKIRLCMQAKVTA